MPDFSVFIDESGNTGSNLLDFKQPIFTFVGIGVEDNSITALSNEVKKVKINYKIKADHVLHAKNIFRAGKENLIKDVMEILFKYEMSLFFTIAEKKYVIASNVEDEFFDPVFNDNCDNTWTYPSPDKVKRANFFYKSMSEDTFIACGHTFQTGENIEKAFELLKKDIQGKPYEINLYDILKGAEPHLSELGDVIKKNNSPDNPIGAASGVAMSPNFLSFTGLINKVEQFYSFDAENKVQLFFDSSKQFNIAFLNIFKKYRDAQNTIVSFPDKLPLVFGYKHIRNFIAEKDQKSTPLQLSDLAATSIRNVVDKIYLDDGSMNYSVFEMFILFLTYTHWERFNDTFCAFVMSEDLIKKIYKILFLDKRNLVLKDIQKGKY